MSGYLRFSPVPYVFSRLLPWQQPQTAFATFATLCCLHPVWRCSVACHAEPLPLVPIWETPWGLRPTLKCSELWLKQDKLCKLSHMLSVAGPLKPWQCRRSSSWGYPKSGGLPTIPYNPCYQLIREMVLGETFLRSQWKVYTDTRWSPVLVKKCKVLNWYRTCAALQKIDIRRQE